jgi:hypothetical protein
VVLLVDRRQHDERDAAPLAQLPAELRAVSVRQCELDDRGSGRTQRRRVGRLVGGRRRFDAEAGLTQDHAERAHGPHVVVAHEYPLHHGRARRRR